LANAFTALFAWDVDFSRDVKPGDQFKILYERFYRTDDEGQEVYVRPGRILVAIYKGARGSHTALHYETADGHGGYYRADGTSIEREFLLSPLEYGRVTSKFTMARKHPILKITRPHQGIDYAAPEGTPIWAVADGTVISKGMTNGFGRTVKVRHANGYISYYTHMSRYRTGLHVGQRVTQKELVGYVGHSGLATGPHVCFRIAKDGHYVDPKKLRSPAGKPIPSNELAAFESRRNALFAALDETSNEGGSDAVAMVSEDATSL
jgi:murein DD-endopeptidase MepM/ murein hydrolase activator NlpD